MAAYTSTQSGNWSDTATWGGSGPPGDGDTATIAAGHTVNIDGTVVVGTSPSDTTTMVVTVKSSAQLLVPYTLSADVSFTVKGNMKIETDGIFSIGHAGYPIPASKTVTFTMATNLYAYWYILNNGYFGAFGAHAYHMADELSQRAKLSADVTAGSGVTFSVNANVDWTVGDYIYVGIGGKKDDTFPTDDTVERIQITGKTNAHTYTATFAYAHKTNDFVVQASRNVILSGGGNNNAGFSVYSCNAIPTSVASIVLVMDWVLIRYGSQSSAAANYGSQYGAIRYILTTAVHTTVISSDNLRINNCVFDQSGANRSSGYTSGHAVYVSTSGCYMQDDTLLFENNHIYDYDGGFTIDVPGTTVFNNISLIKMSGYAGFGFLLRNSSSNLLTLGTLNAVWCSSHRHTAYYGTRVSDGIGCYTAITNCEIHHAYSGFTRTMTTFGSGGSGSADRSVSTDVYSCKFYHIGSSAVESLPHGNMRQCEFWYCANIDKAPVYLLYYRNSKVSTSTFDACNTLIYGNASGTVWAGGYNNGGVLRFVACDFGMTSRNTRFNICLEEQGYIGYGIGSNRVLVDNCSFKEPISYPGGYFSSPYYTKSMHWSVGAYYYTAWHYRMSTPSRYSVQWTDCAVQTSAGANQWSTDYPSCTKLTLGPGGGESREEITNVLDNTFNRKMLPFWTLHSMCVNRTEPIRVPVKAGNAVTCKLSFKKNANGGQAQPGLWLYGAGIDNRATTTPGVFGSWEELTVSGTATSEGFCNLYVFAGTNIAHDNSSFYVYPGMGPPPGNVSTPDVMYDVTVYADGLSVEVA